ncbi:MAG: phosphoglycerate dehydrogenase [Candidatus Omnitrophica bacterium]|nr:phosphoglycerate dehydrogenase [Candidatus Omnitrophota bacterium]MCM8798501.1 phosphoglycerate dehydrogenase [Candidatus Omnitrophota bacterium]
MKILVSDPLAEEGLKILREEKEFEVEVKLKQPEEVLKEIIKDYDALIVRSETKVTAGVIERANRLKVIGRAGVGLDNIDVEAATKKGVIVMNAPEGNTISTAEHTMSLMLALSRNIARADVSLKRGEWERKKFMGVELYGKVLGIVGLGRIGREVAKRAMSFGMRVIAYDPYLAGEKAESLGVELVDWEELLKKSDYISFHVPLTEETKHMVSEREFALMKKGVRIINCARGGIIDESALAKAIAEGIVEGAALDVFEQEPPQNSPLLKLDKVVITPHLGASTEEAQINVSVDIARQVKDVLLGKSVRNAVNFPSVEAHLLALLRPYLTLSEKLGAMHTQLSQGHIKEVKIKYIGQTWEKLDTQPLTIALLKGMLSPILQETVNFVNAPFIAKERGIKIDETKTTETEDFVQAIAAEMITDKGRNTITGTLFVDNSARIVKINEFYVEAIPQGVMLILYNWDKPGVVGNIGTILGKNNINIAGMTFGREKPGGKAITVLNVDSPVPENVLKQLKATENILDVKLIRL